MTFKEYSNLFRVKALLSGFSEDNILKCLQYAEPLSDKKLPIIYNTTNLSSFVGYTKNYLIRAAIHTPYFYRKFNVKKKNGNIRQINEPLPSLKEIQIWILNNILEKVEISRFAKAYKIGTGIYENAKYHKKQDLVFCIDFKDFFPNIKRQKVEKIFLTLGYSFIISNLLSKLCCNEDSLPQGAPTSPMLSNIYLIEFDGLLAAFCVKNKIRYTRYADDLSFSFSSNINPNIILNEVHRVISLLELGLTINENKTRVLKPSDRQVITGIVVNEKLQIAKEKRRKIRQEIYFIKKYGLFNHLIFTKNNRANYIFHLLGKINQALSINPHDLEMVEYKSYIHQLKGDLKDNL